MSLKPVSLWNFHLLFILWIYFKGNIFNTTTSEMNICLYLALKWLYFHHFFWGPQLHQDILIIKILNQVAYSSYQKTCNINTEYFISSCERNGTLKREKINLKKNVTEISHFWAIIKPLKAKCIFSEKIISRQKQFSRIPGDKLL